MFRTSYTGLSVMEPPVHLPLRGTGKAGWFGWPTDPDMEKLRDTWIDAPDLATQKQIARRMQGAAFFARAALQEPRLPQAWRAVHKIFFWHQDSVNGSGSQPHHLLSGRLLNVGF